MPKSRIRQTCKARFLLVSLLALLLADLALSDDGAGCTDVDLRAALGPVRFQDDKSWCFAFAAADLLTYRFQKELHGERVSDVYTALSYTRDFAIDPYSDAGGFARLAVVASEQMGFCPQSIEEQALRRGPSGSLNEKLETLRALKTMYDRGDLEGLNRKLDELAKTDSVVTSLPREELMKTLRESSKRSFPLAFGDLLCGGHRFKPSARVQVKSMIKWEASTAAMLRAIDQQLSARNIVAIGYYSAFLVFGNSAPPDGRHMSVLVGRRWNGKLKRCEYLIRNSFGPGCLGYAGEYRSEENCQAGHIWVSKAVLARNLYAVTYIVP